MKIHKSLGLTVDASRPTCIEYTPCGSQVAMGAVDGSISVFDTDTMRRVNWYVCHDAMVTAITYLSDGATLATCGSDGFVMVWEVARWQKPAEVAFRMPRQIATFTKIPADFTEMPPLVTFPDYPTACCGDAAAGMLAIGTMGGDLLVVNLADMSEIAHFATPGTVVTAVELSGPFFRLRAAWMDRTLRVWDTRSWVETLSPPSAAGQGRAGNPRAPGVPSTWARNISFSPMGHSFAAICRETKRMAEWDLHTRLREFTMRARADDIASLAYSQDGDLLSAVCFSGFLQVWQISSRNSAALKVGCNGECVRAWAPRSKDMLLVWQNGRAEKWSVD